MSVDIASASVEAKFGCDTQQILVKISIFNWLVQLEKYKLLHTRIYGDQHVIIPRHLRVPSLSAQLFSGLNRSGSTKTILLLSKQLKVLRVELGNFCQAYNSSASYVTPFFPTIFEDNVHGQSSASLLEARSSHAMNNISTAFVITQPNQSSQQLQQAVPQLYSQVHVPHYTNFMPYRHVFSPVYGPPMAMTNYSSNPAYAHPSNGSNYLLMPGGSSHLPAVGMKYAPPQYKPVHAGSPSVYGSYSTPAAFAIGTPGSLGGPTVHEDINRIKYKDNNLYVPNQQAEASDMWIQTPRELPGLQSTPYFNLPGHAGHSTSFVSGQAAAAGAPHSPVHFPPVYHTPQPGSITSPHPVVHQQVPAAIGLAAAGTHQAGAFPQSQLGHLNWTANF
ncbi:hypothetical protein HPP92_018748 [Vanilla planifolia]|uniref:GBF-interacting protein 1 N-terminal domain-containing protein n=1 Tax=Vanilla planifolia TaxID=51239 RepID=A0A835Q2R4_VANPL|nr:hypothetical protein HPP92_018748 [Vanilla planifolia]